MCGRATTFATTTAASSPPHILPPAGAVEQWSVGPARRCKTMPAPLCVRPKPARSVADAKTGWGEGVGSNARATNIISDEVVAAAASVIVMTGWAAFPLPPPTEPASGLVVRGGGVRSTPARLCHPEHLALQRNAYRARHTATQLTHPTTSDGGGGGSGCSTFARGRTATQ